MAEPSDGRPRWKRIAWFVGLWAAGVLTITVIGAALRAVLGLP